MRDRFTEASGQLSEMNPYIFSGSMKQFGHETIGHIDTETGDERGSGTGTYGIDCLILCDPAPFGD